MALEILDTYGDRVMWGNWPQILIPTASDKGKPLQPGDKVWNCDTDETKVYCNGAWRTSANG